MYKILIVLSALTLLQGCATHTPTTDIDDALSRAALQHQEIAAGPFILTTWSRLSDRDKPITIYIEGEDKPFAYTSAIEMTPTNPVALKLAAIDPSANVVYIARPCQFTSYDPACAPDLIKNGRFSKQVIISINRVIDHFVVPLSHPQINLVGYGSGGAVAALIAAKRQQQSDVVSLRTVAANMDPEGLARYEGFDGADDLIDPMPIALRLSSLPQEHFVGDKDTIIPPFITANFFTQAHARQCGMLTSIPDATHDQGWEKFWEGHATDIPVCGKMLQTSNSDNPPVPNAQF